MYKEGAKKVNLLPENFDLEKYTCKTIRPLSSRLGPVCSAALSIHGITHWARGGIPKAATQVRVRG